jgi:hypothetical protein
LNSIFFLSEIAEILAIATPETVSQSHFITVQEALRVLETLSREINQATLIIEHGNLRTNFLRGSHLKLNSLI